ncbi:MAG: SGNH/GDSL hydrolase family protein [Phycisphaerales bacterium]|nr:SGNH/GDSL hydrolase family protein [Phycisphaerales bacterium]
MSEAATSSVRSRPRRRIGRLLGVIAVLGLLGIAGAEIGARVVLGLGDPPLYVLDPEVEYLLKPSQDRRPLGNRFFVNSRSMRAEEFPDNKASADELRVLVIGDSIVNGGVKIDQAALATERLGPMLRDRLKRPVVVGNASAGSWGPPNELGYLKKFGVMRADVVVLVLNSGDVEDVPGLEAIGPQWPRHTPALALLEIGERKLPGVFGRLTGNAAAGPPAHRPDPVADRALVRESIVTIARVVRAAGAKPVAVLYWAQADLRSPTQPALETLRTFLAEAGMPVLETRERFEGRDGLMQGDGVHPTPEGQAALAEVLLAEVERAMQADGR